MPSIALRRARERYLAKKRFPLSNRSEHGHKAGNIVIWIAGIGLLLVVMFLWMATNIFSSP